MNWYENINISFSYEPILFLLGILIIFAYTIFIYRSTLPKIGRLSKAILISLRSAVLILLLFLLFDPIIKLTTSNKVEPENLIFIDNSKSVGEFASPAEREKLNLLIDVWNNDLTGNKKFFTFGTKTEEIKNPSENQQKYGASSTSFNSVVQEIKKTNNVSSVLIISDGINNEGKNPENELSQLAIPIYTIGIGDTTSFADLAVENIKSNNFVYANRETELEIVIKNEDLSDKTAAVQLLSDQTLIETKSIQLSQSGINRVTFPFKSSKAGEHKLTVKVSTDLNEKNKSNNQKSTVINILDTKKKIAVISGSPSEDLSIITNSIRQNEDFETAQIVELKPGIFYNKSNNINIVKESDILFLVGFPGSNSDDNLIKEIESIISSTNKPFFFCFTNSIDFNKLKLLQKIIPFQFNSISQKFVEDQVGTNNTASGLMGNGESNSENWNNLPPISVNQTKIVPSASSEILVSSKLDPKRPIIFTNNSANRKSIVLAAANIWRWKLKTPDKENMLFDNFILNSVKWLAISPQNQFFDVKIDKKNYRLGETITFNANLYNDTYEPINNENIKIDITNGSVTKQFNFSSLGNGLYEANIDLSKPGLYKFSAKPENSSRELAPITGSFNIEPIEVELVESKLNKRFLESISQLSGGKYYNINQTEYLINELNSNYQSKIYFKKTDKELRLSTFELILMIIVLLFSVEWITRKFLRMI